MKAEISRHWTPFWRITRLIANHCMHCWGLFVKKCKAALAAPKTLGNLLEKGKDKGKEEQEN